MQHNQTELAMTMRIVTHKRYGSANLLEINETTRPECGPNEVLVAVKSVSVNPFDWHTMTGTPLPLRLSGGLFRPKENRLGVDVAGVVESVGTGVDRYKVGDKVFGFADGCFAEFVCAKQNEIMKMPDNVSFDEAAAVPIAALTAIQGLVNQAEVKANQHVLVNGASGGVGTFAVQIAKELGAQVTGVCGPSNGGIVRALGADHVIDYTKEDFTQNQGKFDVILDNVGNRAMSQYKKCLKPTGRFVVVGARKGFFLGPILQMLKALLAFKFSKQRAHVFMASRSPQDIKKFTDLLASRSIEPVIDCVYPFEEIKKAMNHLETGHARGKIIVKVSD